MQVRLPALIVLAVCGSAARAQPQIQRPNAAPIVRGALGEDIGGQVHVAQEVVASLSYDGSSAWGFAGQDFESIFDQYDLYCIEPFSLDQRVVLTEFRSAAFGTGNPFGVEDVLVEVYHVSDLADLCDGGDLPRPLLRSFRRSGFFDGLDMVASFSNECLGPGDFVIRWSARMDLLEHGQIFFRAQGGEHDNGGGIANDGIQQQPNCSVNCPSVCVETVDGKTQLATGVNFMLIGEVVDECVECRDQHECGDMDGDGDSDADDFSAFLHMFASREPCADIDHDGDHDLDDYFGYFDRFVRRCP